jgi:hypothetical protein
VYASPTGHGALARYRERVRYRAAAGESVPIELDGQAMGQVGLTDLLPA